MLSGRRTAEHRWMADVRPTRTPGAVDRRAAAPPAQGRPGSQEPAPGPAGGTDRVGCRRRAPQRRDRPPVSGHPRHRTQVAGPVRRRHLRRAARPKTLRSPAPVHPGAAGPGQGPGLRAARGQRGAAVAVERRRGGPRGGHRRSGRCHQRHHRASLAARRCAQTVAIPIVDRPTGTGLRRPRRRRAGPVRRKLRRRATRPGRLRAVRG
jgi:hypothetical protein